MSDPLNVCGISVWFVPYSLSKSNVLDAVTASFDPCSRAPVARELILEAAGEAGRGIAG